MRRAMAAGKGLSRDSYSIAVYFSPDTAVILSAPTSSAPSAARAPILQLYHIPSSPALASDWARLILTTFPCSATLVYCPLSSRSLDRCSFETQQRCTGHCSSSTSLLVAVKELASRLVWIRGADWTRQRGKRRRRDASCGGGGRIARGQVARTELTIGHSSTCEGYCTLRLRRSRVLWALAAARQTFRSCSEHHRTLRPCRLYPLQ